jgi:hypothetical protein
MIHQNKKIYYLWNSPDLKNKNMKKIKKLPGHDFFDSDA